MLETFGNHPSFVMFSLGNELWGSPERLGEILRHYKEKDSRHLYTQGCNNFQHFPLMVPEDDYFVGVRLSKERSAALSACVMLRWDTSRPTAPAPCTSMTT